VIYVPDFIALPRLGCFPFVCYIVTVDYVCSTLLPFVPSRCNTLTLRITLRTRGYGCLTRFVAFVDAHIALFVAVVVVTTLFGYTLIYGLVGYVYRLPVAFPVGSHVVTFVCYALPVEDVALHYPTFCPRLPIWLRRLFDDVHVCCCYLRRYPHTLLRRCCVTTFGLFTVCYLAQPLLRLLFFTFTLCRFELRCCSLPRLRLPHSPFTTPPVALRLRLPRVGLHYTLRVRCGPVC